MAAEPTIRFTAKSGPMIRAAFFNLFKRVQPGKQAEADLILADFR